MSLSAGADGCKKGGWLLVFLEEGGAFRLRGIVPDFASLGAKTRDARLTLVDVPVGLPEGPEGRECDRAARRLLGPRRSSV
ncbi:MAG: DUF429 domain-containing protein, partial [Thermaerobacter sp.]|nr:DUF429 domain-containing protein [Thermaerobacter sp.]